MENADATKKGGKMGWFWALVVALFVSYMGVTMYGAMRDVFSGDRDTVYEVSDTDKSVRCFIYRSGISCVAVGSENAAAEKLQIPVSSLQSRQVVTACTPLGLQPNPNSCHRY